MGTNGSALKYTTKCRIKDAISGQPCGHQIVDHALNVAIVGKPDARLQNFIGALMKHVEKKHPGAWMQLQGMWHHFLGFLILGQFETEDPAIIQSVQGFGAVLRDIVKLPPIPDADIEGATAALGFTMEDPNRQNVIQALKNVRAYYEGTLQKPATEKPLVTL